MSPPHRRRRARLLAIVVAIVAIQGCTTSTGPEPTPSSTASSSDGEPTATPSPDPASPSSSPAPDDPSASSAPPPAVSTTPPADTPEPTEPGTIVVTSADGVVSRVTPGDGTVEPISDVTGAAQVTPSPDGSTLVFSRLVDGAPVVTVLGEESSTDVSVPTAPYFHLVSPTGDRVVSLGNATDGDQVSVLVTDVAAGTSQEVDRGRPYFLSWRADGAVLAANIDAAVVATVDPDGSREPVPVTPGAFQAPVWTGDDRLVVVLEDASVDAVPITSRVAARVDREPGDRAQLAAQPVTQPAAGTLAVVDPVDQQVTTLAAVSGAVSFDVADDRVAWVAGDSGQAASLGPLEVIGLDGRDRATITDDDVAMFEWSPDGSRLLFHVVDPDRGFVPHVWDGTTVTAYEPFLPTPTLAVQYLPFWPQYTQAVTQWAPDGSAFAVADAGDDDPGTVVVQQLDGQRRELVPGEMVVWSR
ncbi:hypothetical protein [Salsipaludibacter albus]|uniref:hypothetical protein n=1 Tax=Salsipaludibacter albus TaxID=2849650 RepID=UPI001EE438AB|nr:hypothetical protein [Salsipaludibacter albus]MBY5164385.1 hypothetical protein [Salsipaludibacter albus]